MRPLPPPLSRKARRSVRLAPLPPAPPPAASRGHPQVHSGGALLQKSLFRSLEKCFIFK